jgi:hypothetical protein
LGGLFARPSDRLTFAQEMSLALRYRCSCISQSDEDTTSSADEPTAGRKAFLKEGSVPRGELATEVRGMVEAAKQFALDRPCIERAGGLAAKTESRISWFG